MFEKEAMKDYEDNLKGKLEVNNESRLEEQFEYTFSRGAICGYHKAKDEVITEATKNYNAIIAEYEKHYKERIAELEKANEWHYVKDEKDLPTDKKEYLLLLGSGIRTFGFYNGRFWESWKGDFSWQEVKAYFFVSVPELKESE